MRIPGSLALVALVLSISGCATASVSYSNVMPGREPVSAISSHFNVLGLTPTSIGRLAELRDELVEQCGGRAVTGVVAKTSTVYAVIGVIEKTEVVGHCVEP